MALVLTEYVPSNACNATLGWDPHKFPMAASIAGPQPTKAPTLAVEQLTTRLG